MKHFVLTLFLLSNLLSLKAQVFTVNGYLKDMEGFYILENSLPGSEGKDIKSINYNLVHNRLNFKVFPSKNFIVALELRNRLFSGKLVEMVPDYAESIATDDGIVDLSWNLIEQDKWFLNSSIDRFYIDYTLGRWQVRAGRQRINWGINLVWNPNDIFNAFSYMDFDYEERPGSDAVLLTYYPSNSSSIDLAYKAAKDKKNRAYAAKYRFNLFDYDFQFLAGQAGYDYVLGGGWSGAIWNIAFRGEASWFKPLNNKKDVSKEAFSGTVSFDYSFENSLYLHTSFLYNSSGTTEKGQGFSLIDPNLQLSAKNLSIGKYEIFGQLSYPIGSLVNTSLAVMYNPVDFSMFIGPSVSFSLHDDVEFYLTSQIMLGEQGTEYGALGNLYAIFGRLRWSF